MSVHSELFDRLRVAYLAPSRRQLAEAWRWWTNELLAMLPENLRTALGISDRRVYLVLGIDEVIAFGGTAQSLNQIARLPLGRPGQDGHAEPMASELANATLVLPARQTLTKRITLPAATEENLRGVLEFEMDRETPFSAEQVYFDGVVAGRSAQRRTIDVELLLTPKRYLDELLDRLSTNGIRPAAVTAKNRRGKLVDANLVPLGRAPVKPRPFNLLNGGLAAATCLLLAAAIALPIQHKRAAIAELTPQVEAAMEAARDGSRIRDNIEQLHRGAQNLIDRKTSSPMILELLDAATRVVPDDTWVAVFEADGSVIQLRGESSIAASLIELLDQSTSFEDPEFRAPVTRARNSDKERFNLSARWSQGVDNAD